MYYVAFLFEYFQRLSFSFINSTQFFFVGVVLQRLIFDPHLAGISHVIVDEVHERGIHEDLLLVKLFHLLQSGKRPDLRIICMSATLNAEVFQTYFQPVARVYDERLIV